MWETAREAIRKDGNLYGLANRILSYPDWTQAKNDGICIYCGKRAGQPFTADNDLHIAGLLRDEDGKTDAPYPDPKAKKHTHTPFEPVSAEDDITQENYHKWSLLWGYIINPQNNRFRILKSVYIPEEIRKKGVVGSRRSVMVDIACFDLLGQGPDWQQIEDDANDIASLIELGFSRNENHPLLKAIKHPSTVHEL